MGNKSRTEDTSKVEKKITDSNLNDLQEQEKRIESIISDYENDFDLIEKWLEYLESNVELPCKVIYNGHSRDELKSGTEITLNDFVDSDEHYGIIGAGKFNRQTINFPLCEVEPVTITPKNQPLYDYVVWFANQ